MPVKRFYAKLGESIAVLLIGASLLIAVTPRAEDFTLQQGKRLMEEEEFEQAKDVLLKVIENEPENAEANFLLCKAYVILDDHDNAIEYGKKAVELDDSVSDYHLWLGQAHGMQAQKGSKLKAIFRANRARKEFEMAVFLDSANIDARLVLAEYLMMAPGVAGGSMSKAEYHAGKIEQMDSLFGAFAWSSYWQKRKDMVKAEDYLKSAIRLDTTSNHQATYRLGFFLNSQKRYLEAAGAFEKTLTKHPDETGILYQVGRSCVFAKDSLDKAERCFKQYLQTELRRNTPSWAAAHWRLGMVYDLKGETDLAMVEMEEAVRLDPENKDFQTGLKIVKKKKK
jgi:tetratricopeptide (TPR) repeat protein